MNQLVEGLKDTEVIHDDFLIVGCGDTDDEAEAVHDRNMKAFLERGHNIRPNADKLKMTQVPYIGHLLITRNGLRVDPRNVEAIEKMQTPKDAKAAQRMLASVNLAKFVQHLPHIMHPSDDSSTRALSEVGCIPTNSHSIK